jgi:hypothetical protein
MGDGLHPYKARPVAGTHTWLTPPEIIEALGPFDLDPCAAPSPRPWPTAARHIELPECGLTAEWQGRVWLNPPFGSYTGQWLGRMALHGNGIALTFARTDTRMFRQHVWPFADGVMFLHGRPHFHAPDGTRATGNSGGPICLIAYGEDNARALQASGLRGAFLSVAKEPAMTNTGQEG